MLVLRGESERPRQHRGLQHFFWQATLCLQNLFAKKKNVAMKHTSFCTFLKKNLFAKLFLATDETQNVAMLQCAQSNNAA